MSLMGKVLGGLEAQKETWEQNLRVAPNHLSVQVSGLANTPEMIISHTGQRFRGLGLAGWQQKTLTYFVYESVRSNKKAGFIPIPLHSVGVQPFLESGGPFLHPTLKIRTYVVS